MLRLKSLMQSCRSSYLQRIIFSVDYCWQLAADNTLTCVAFQMPHGILLFSVGTVYGIRQFLLILGRTETRQRVVNARILGSRVDLEQVPK